MGMVVAATHLHLQQRVALKFLLPELAQNPEVVERFVREARASAQLYGEHVCRVSDVGASDLGAPFIVMELLEGRDLASCLGASGSLPVARVADYVLQACVGIAEAHALGIVHRDLKPGNLFLTARPDGTPLIKVLDFGIAKAQRDRSFSLTHTSAVLGSPTYMSPEQLRSSRDVDVRSDVWSIGVILYELVSGKPPFTGDSITDLAFHIRVDPTPPLTRPAPPGFELVVQRCLEKEPARRYPDLAALTHELAEFAGPTGRDLASTVSRLLRRTQPPPRATSSNDAERADAPVDPKLVATTQPDVTVATGQGSRAAGSIPTTMGSAASSMATASSGRRRWGVIAGVAATSVLGAWATIAALGNTGTPISPTSPAPALEDSAVPPPPDAAKLERAATPLDGSPVDAVGPDAADAAGAAGAADAAGAAVDAAVAAVAAVAPVAPLRARPPTPLRTPANRPTPRAPATTEPESVKPPAARASGPATPPIPQPPTTEPEDFGATRH
jgi:eukaryotic-like serine/threonine-protein kinase